MNTIYNSGEKHLAVAICNNNPDSSVYDIIVIYLFIIIRKISRSIVHNYNGNCRSLNTFFGYFNATFMYNTVASDRRIGHI